MVYRILLVTDMNMNNVKVNLLLLQILFLADHICKLKFKPTKTEKNFAYHTSHKKLSTIKIYAGNCYFQTVKCQITNE